VSQRGIRLAAKRLTDQRAGIFEVTLVRSDDAEMMKRIEIMTIEAQNGAIDPFGVTQLPLAAQQSRLLDHFSEIGGYGRPAR
jgi:hypothetical protein